MRIAIIPSADLSYNSGSVIYAKKLFSYLHSKGHCAYLLGCKPPDDLPSGLMPFVRLDQRILEHPIIDDRPVSHRDYLNSITATAEYLLDVGLNNKCDIVHAHYGSFTSFAACLAHGLTGIPYVISSFGRDLRIGYRCDKRIKWLYERSVADARCVIVPEQGVKDMLCQLFPAAGMETKVVVIPMPVDELIFESGTVNFGDSSPVIATVNSCFSPEKGIATIIEAFRVVRDVIPCKLLIAGGDDHPDQRHLQTLRAIIQRLALTESVVFVGYLSRQNVGELLRCATVLVDARINGNFSSILLEALSIGTPVITSRYPGSETIVQHGINGFVVPQGSPIELASVLIDVLQDTTKLEPVRRNIQAFQSTIMLNYSETNCFERVLSVYRDACNGTDGC
jgi:glycosyltransferase involved in cell wall biosynthesis